MADRNVTSKNTKNKKKSKGGKTVAGAALLLALLGGGGYFGLGIGNESGGLIPVGVPETTVEQAASSAEQTQAVTETPVETTPEETKEQVITIRVKESDILYQEQKVSLEELEEALAKDYKEGMKIELIDDHAILDVIDNVKSVLEKLHLSFEKTTAGN